MEKAYIQNNKVVEPQKDLEIIENTDVIVCGGGPTGIGAAVSAAKNGAKVVLIEQSGCLGGLGTNGLVTSFMSMSAYTGGRQIIKGVWEDLINRLEKEQGAIRSTDIKEQKPNFGKLRCEPDTGVTAVDVEVYKRVADQMMLELGVTVYFHTIVTNAIMDGNTIKGVIIESKSGRQAIIGKRVVDATGDADVAAYAGAEFDIGRPEDNVTMPLTTMFTVGGMDDTTRTHKWDPSTAYGAVNLFPLLRDGEYRVEMTRASGSGINVKDLSKAEMNCRSQIPNIIEHLRETHEGAENIYLISSASTVGVQDSRRIKGEYELTEDDVLNYKIPDDVILMNGYGVDIHNPEGGGALLNWLIPGHAYGIPYRCLVPLHIENLLVAGRSISANVSAQSSIRIMAGCMGTGEAAGAASALSIKEGSTVRDLSVEKLQSVLRSQNVYLGENEPPVPEKKSYLVTPGMKDYEWNK